MRQCFIILLFSTLLCSCQSKEATPFKDQQQRYPRVRAAVLEKDRLLRKHFLDQGLHYPPKHLFIRVFKHQKVLEVWTYAESDAIYKKIRDYPICRTSGRLGPKRRQGDRQIPEGFYYINRFNPKSRFHLSLGINYPNGSDEILGETDDLGGDIFLHGGCVTIGCIPITDDAIKEVYWLAVQAKSQGQSQIPVHIFPTKLDHDTITELKHTTTDESLIKFWANLQMGYQVFEKHRNLPNISVNSNGAYQFSTTTLP